MKNAFLELRHLVSTLDIGVTDRSALCPFCGGGRSREKAFSITRISEIEAKYCCHRASCSKAGRIASLGHRLESDSTSSVQRGEAKEFTPRLYSGDTEVLDGSWMSELSLLYGLGSDEWDRASWRYNPETRRLVCPVFGYTKTCRGYETRGSKSGNYSGPKTVHYRESDETWMGWYRSGRENPRAVLLVEDLISALKGSCFYDTASLMGSHVALDHVLESVEVAKDRPILLALDPDATSKAMNFILKWKFIAPNFVPIPLSKDLKYLTNEEIEGLYNGN